MDAKKVSELTAATEVLDSDTFVMEQGGIAKKVTAAILKAIFGSADDGGNEEETASNGLPAGGTAGQMLVKASAEDYDTVWQDVPEVSAKKASAADFSSWADGAFTVTIDGEAKPGTVEFDDNGNPTSVTLDGHTLSITLPA